MDQIISPDNKLQNILDFDVCKQLVNDAIENNESMVILCPHFSINIQSKYQDGEELGWDLDELNDYIDNFVEVNDYDDLVVYLTSNED
jgi:hypothetical protein